jgi:hypothetical protein
MLAFKRLLLCRQRIVKFVLQLPTRPAYDISARTCRKRFFHYCCPLLFSVETCMFAEPLLSRGCRIVICFTIVA